MLRTNVLAMLALSLSVCLPRSAPAQDATMRATDGATPRPSDGQTTPPAADDGPLAWDNAYQRIVLDGLGARAALAERGITLEGYLAWDWVKDLHGGASTDGDSTLALLDIALSIDTQKLMDWPGGTFMVDFQNQAGDSPSQDVGDFQWTNGNEADGRTQLAELWYEQGLFDQVVRVKVGKMDPGCDFTCTDQGAEFVHAAATQTATVFPVIPTYPDPAVGASVFVEPCEWFYAGAGLYDGALAEGVPTGSRGPKTFFGDPGDLFIIGEVGARWAAGSSALAGRLALGGWGHTGTFDRWDGGTSDGAEGFYLVLDQQLWRENPEDEDDAQGLGAFLLYGWADAEIFEVSDHLAIGLAWTGLLPARDADVTGAGFSTAWFTDRDEAGFTDAAETAIEAFHKLQITDWFSLKPDVQYVINPSAAGLRDAVVFTLRAELVF